MISHNGWGWQGLWLGLVQNLLRQGQPDQSVQNYIQVAFEDLLGGNSSFCLGELCHYSATHTVKSAFVIFKLNLLCSSLCHCFLSSHRAPVKKMLGSVLFVPCLQVFRHIDVIPWASCRLNTPSFLRLFSTEVSCSERLRSLFPGDFQKLPACGSGHPSVGIPAWADRLYRSLPTSPVCDLKVL